MLAVLAGVDDPESELDSHGSGDGRVKVGADDLDWLTGSNVSCEYLAGHGSDIALENIKDKVVVVAIAHAEVDGE